MGKTRRRGKKARKGGGGGLTVARRVAGSAQIAIYLYVSLRGPDGVAGFVGPGAGSCFCMLVHIVRKWCALRLPGVGNGGADLDVVGAAEAVIVA